MNLKNVKIGDEVVSFPFGIGKVENIDSYRHYPIHVEFKYSHEHFTFGGALFDKQPTSCWPINDAPEWIWGALGIKKPKKKVMKTKVMYGNFDGNGRLLNIYSSDYDAKLYAPKTSVAFAVKFTSEPFEVEE